MNIFSYAQATAEQKKQLQHKFPSPFRFRLKRFIMFVMLMLVLWAGVSRQVSGGGVAPYYCV